VVCGVDGSPSATDAAWAAARAAAWLGVGLHLVRALEWPAAGVPGLPPGDAGRVAARRSALTELSRLADAVQVSHPGVPVTGGLTDGTAADVLTSAAVGASLLVVGVRGHSAREGPRAGSVAVALARSTPGPLLVHRQAAPGADGVVVADDGAPGSAALLDTALGTTRPGLQACQRVSRVPSGALLLELSATSSLAVVGRPPGAGPLAETTSTLLRRGPCAVLVVPVR
jgi:nucleotide-binding universal stress UspA family protein